MDILMEFLRKKKIEDEAKEMPKEKEWYLHFSGMLTTQQKNSMFEKRLHSSKINSFLISVFALTGTFISAYETESYLAVNQKDGISSKTTWTGTFEQNFTNYTADREDSVNFGLRMIVTFTTAITSKQILTSILGYCGCFHQKRLEDYE